jgi:demethoxyubiquinone hydroxylase (CLK1/Coq7/Cat5 family)
MLSAGRGAVRYISLNSAAPLRTRKGRIMDSIIRVDHAGEFGADRIYAGQMAVLGQIYIYTHIYLYLQTILFQNFNDFVN